MGLYTVYEANGVIILSGCCPDGDESLYQGGYYGLLLDAVSNPIDYYVAGIPGAPVLTERPLLTTVATWNKTTITANGTDSATLGAGLPNPTTVIINIVTAEGAEPVDNFTVTDGSLVFKSNIIGEYSILAQTISYKDYLVTITAEAP
jgi:hypothetical protein